MKETLYIFIYLLCSLQTCLWHKVWRGGLDTGLLPKMIFGEVLNHGNMNTLSSQTSKTKNAASNDILMRVSCLEMPVSCYAQNRK